MCDKVGHMVKDFPHFFFRAAFISAVKGSGSTRGARGRESGARGGCHGDTQSGGGTH